MKHLTAILIITCFTLTAFSQKITGADQSFARNNSIQLELFGHGLFYSVNYERIILNGQKFKTTAQAGISYYPPSTGVIDIWIPVVLNELISFNQHHAEVGAGYIFINEALRGMENEVMSRNWDGFITARLGYRYQKPAGRFLFRAAFTPIFEYSETKEFHPSGGLAVGYIF